MNMLMDNMAHVRSPRRGTPPQHAELRITTTTPPNAAQRLSPNNNNNNNNETQISPATNLVNQNAKTTTTTTTFKRSFDVAFLMMPDERIKLKQQQAEKQARLTEALERHHQQQQMQLQYPTDLSPRAQLAATQQQPPQAQTPPEHFSLLEAKRYTQLALRSPRIYDDPTVIIPNIDVTEISPLKSAFTKVHSSASSSSTSSRLESPNDSTAPPLSPDQLSCHSMSPPVTTPPPRTNSGGGGNVSLPNGLPTAAAALPPNPIIYHNFRPEYQFNGAATFQSVNQMQALQAQRLKQQLLYRTPNVNAMNNNGAPPPTASQAPQTNIPPPEFLHAAYPGFPFPPNAANCPPGHPFISVGAAQPEMPRIVQHPAAAAILSTLIPPTLASTFTLTAQNVCAKCNISFRMTSDLVYHMRSHHKSEVAFDPNRRKREEKLRCPVCQETFRERHHLTRHMTAHQDKESDQPVPERSADVANDNEIINVVGLSGPSGRHRVAGLNK